MCRNPDCKFHCSATPSVLMLPSRWRVLLIHLQMWPTPSQSLLTALRGSLWTSTAPNLFSQIMCTGFIGILHMLNWLTDSLFWLFCVSIPSRPGPSARCLPGTWESLWSQAKQRSSAAEKSPEDLTHFFSAFANTLQHVTINDAKPDIWTPGVHAGKDLVAAVAVTVRRTVTWPLK